MSANLGKPSSSHRTGKGQSSFQFPRRAVLRKCSNHGTIALISHASKVMLKVLQARLQYYVIRELPDVQAGFRKSRETRDQIANIYWIKGHSRKISTCFIDYAKASDRVDHNKVWKSLKEVGIPYHLTCLL